MIYNILRSDFFSAFLFALSALGVIAVVVGTIILIYCKEEVKKFVKEGISEIKIKGISFSTYLRQLLVTILIMSIPFVIFYLEQTPLYSVSGILAAGAAGGSLFMPFVTYHYRPFGRIRAIWMSFLTLVFGMWFSCLVMAVLMALPSN